MTPLQGGKMNANFASNNNKLPIFHNSINKTPENSILEMPDGRRFRVKVQSFKGSSSNELVVSLTDIPALPQKYESICFSQNLSPPIENQLKKFSAPSLIQTHKVLYAENNRIRLLIQKIDLWLNIFKNPREHVYTTRWMLRSLANLKNQYQQLAEELCKLCEINDDILGEMNRKIKEINKAFDELKGAYIKDFQFSSPFKLFLEEENEDIQLIRRGLKLCYAIDLIDKQTTWEILQLKRHLEYYQSQIEYRSLNAMERAMMRAFVEDALPKYPLDQDPKKYELPPPILRAEYHRLGMIAFYIEDKILPLLKKEGSIEEKKFYENCDIISKYLRKFQNMLISDRLNSDQIREISNIIVSYEQRLIVIKNSYLIFLKNKEHSLSQHEKELKHRLEIQKNVRCIFDDVFRMGFMARQELKLDEKSMNRINSIVQKFVTNEPLKDLQIWEQNMLNRLKSEHQYLKKLIHES